MRLADRDDACMRLARTWTSFIRFNKPSSLWAFKAPTGLLKSLKAVGSPKGLAASPSEYLKTQRKKGRLLLLLLHLLLLPLPSKRQQQIAAAGPPLAGTSKQRHSDSSSASSQLQWG